MRFRSRARYILWAEVDHDMVVRLPTSKELSDARPVCRKILKPSFGVVARNGANQTTFVTEGCARCRAPLRICSEGLPRRTHGTSKAPVTTVRSCVVAGLRFWLERYEFTSCLQILNGTKPISSLHQDR